MSNYPAVVAPVAELAAWGDLAKKSGVVPPSTTREQAMAIVQTGRELGLQPFQSLRSMSFIGGRLTMSVQLQLALARRQGGRLESIKETDDSCCVTLGRGDERIACTYTINDARKAGLVKPGGAWEKYGRQMLRWRAIGDALRLIAPDLVMGLLDPIEAESIGPIAIGPDAIHEGPVASEFTSPPPETTPQVATGSPKGEDSAGIEGQDTPTSDSSPAAPVSEAQLKKIHASFNEFGISDRDTRRSWIAACLGREAITSSKDISKAEASVVIDALEKAIANLQKGAA
jgi:hypothetical protein